LTAISRVPSERAFGLTVGVACMVFGALAWWRDYQVAVRVLLVLGAMLVIGGLVAPAALRVPNRIWWRFAQVLGWINTRILLSAFFLLILTPVGLLMRLIGRDPLRARTRTASSWQPYVERRRNRMHYDHQF
jgi:uncharacterized membrane protein YfcA